MVTVEVIAGGCGCADKNVFTEWWKNIGNSKQII